MPACSSPIPAWFAPAARDKASRSASPHRVASPSLKAWLAEATPEDLSKPRGKLLFSPRGADLSQPMIEVPCGKCRNCLRSRASDWGTRVSAEAQFWSSNWMITATYADEHLPPDGGLCVDHVSTFIRTARRRGFGRVRYLLCGEYSPAPALRPHYHICAFDLNLPDMVPVDRSSRGHLLYSSPALQALWPYGRINAGEVNADSGAYVASYLLKGDRKRNPGDDYRVGHFIPSTGKVFTGWVAPEFNRMSLRPGIGSAFASEFADELLVHDFLIIDGQRRRLPRAFDKQLAREHEDRHELLKAARLERAYHATQKRMADHDTTREGLLMHERDFSAVMARRVALSDLERGS